MKLLHLDFGILLVFGYCDFLKSFTPVTEVSLKIVYGLFSKVISELFVFTP